MAYLEYKVTKQISTGNGEAFLAQPRRPPAGFVMGELGFGIDERPCSDCQKPCTLDYTLNTLHLINGNNLRVLNNRDPSSVPARTSTVADVRKHYKLGEIKGAPKTKHEHRHATTRMSLADARTHLRAQLKRGGISVVRGEYVDERAWLPSNPNRKGRGGIMRRAVKDANGKIVGVKRIDLRANKLIREHRKLVTA